MTRPSEGDTDATLVVVRGRVQGVHFRASTQREARRLAVTGWVRNRPDGAVEARLEGSDDAVAALLEWINDGGPPYARVDAVEVTRVPREGCSSFEFRHG